MRIQLAYVSPRRDRLKSAAAQALVDDFVKRGNRFAPVSTEGYRTEADLLAAASRGAGRTPPHLLLLDSRGQTLTSEGFAELIRELRDSGTQELMLTIGPPDGWSAAARRQAAGQLSLGAITLPHELALAVLAEQTYRALTILAGHPYHGGHD